VHFRPHEHHPNQFVPYIEVRKKSGVKTTREFEGADMNRVLDPTVEELLGGSSANHPANAIPTVRDEVMLVGDFEGDGTMGIVFPERFVVLRGVYLFCFDPNQVDTSNKYVTVFEAPPISVIPLHRTQVQFPPGGRRVFREHAHTAASTGYELIVQHNHHENENNNTTSQREDHPYDDEPRPPAFLVVDALSKRNKWAEAIQARTHITKPTLLRAGYTTATATSNTERRQSTIQQPTESKKEETTTSTTTKPSASLRASTKMMVGGSGGPINNNKRLPDGRTLEQKVLQVSEDGELAAAVLEFGASDFNDVAWIERFFREHDAIEEADDYCRAMERWHAEMKKSLKGAVLEQYEYFVQASGEMTTMGREVANLKTHIETQLEILQEMKEIEFLPPEINNNDNDHNHHNQDELMGRPGQDHDELMFHKKNYNNKSNDAIINDSIFGEDIGDFLRNKQSSQQQYHHHGASGTATSTTTAGFTAATATTSSSADEHSSAPSIPIPDWLRNDIQDEIPAAIRECRYHAAIELHAKAETEIADLLDKHERPTAYRLTRKQLDEITVLSKKLAHWAKRISGRLQETLRRKNEALRQASRRERAEAAKIEGGIALMPLVSPCALHDDGLYLHLLVRLGRNQEAAEAFSARRSLLLMETLQERPISGAGSIDLVIYAAQLSQSFFSCLANSVEGFLDLFLISSSSSSSSAPQSSLHINSGGGTSNIHQMMMMNGGGGGDKLEDISDDASSLHSHSLGSATKNLPAGAVASLVLWCDSELSKFANAFGGARILSNLALSPPIRGMPKGPRVVGDDDVSKERQNAIEVAAQCLDQAFLYASQNLDSVGLPLTPRLAEMLRVRLKGCETEVATLLDERWHTLTQEWRNVENVSPTSSSLTPARF
jgi:hypothetical protein